MSSLTSENLTSTIRLTWDAPPTLDITGVDTDIWYDINATTAADNTDGTPLAANFSVGIPQFNFTMDYPNTTTSVVYEFRVTPRNDAGFGPTSDPVTGFFSGRELMIAIYTHSHGYPTYNHSCAQDF